MGFHIKITQPAVATIANRGLHVDSPVGFGGRRHRSPSSIDELYFCDSERLMSIFFVLPMPWQTDMRMQNKKPQSYGVLPATTP